MSQKAVKLLKVPNNGQISIGKKWAGREVKLEVVSDNEIRIVSGIFVPEHQKTLMHIFPSTEDIVRLERLVESLAQQIEYLKNTR